MVTELEENDWPPVCATPFPFPLSAISNLRMAWQIERRK